MFIFLCVAFAAGASRSCCSSSGLGQDSPQVDTSYVDPYRYVERDPRKYYVQEPSRNQEPNSRQNEDLLNRFLDTQNPKYFDPRKYPEQVRPDDPELLRDRDGTPPGGIRTDYIPDKEIRNLLYQIDSVLSEQCTANVDAQWAFETNINEATQLAAVSNNLNADLCCTELG
ncbi:Angiotensin-converting enzyme [Nesidiocoris tenuis]|uniref:Angiotensin-converting enzyme n=1 Tax=Nesidiocoris tenuis TaxID=355587 RepID=A0ABN7B0W3_9HEMI|nr:Angiotensin-converting enzyme [Nesidiocoris tenuis]